MHYRQVTSEQRPQILVLFQKKTAGKETALSTGVSRSTLSRELKRNGTRSERYLRNKARGTAMARRRRTTENSYKDSIVVWEALEHVR